MDIEIIERGLEWMEGKTLLAAWVGGVVVGFGLMASSGPVRRGFGRLFRSPAYLDYRRDLFLGVHWSWSYIRKTVADLQATCAQCDAALVFHSMPRKRLVGGEVEEAHVLLYCQTCEEVRAKFPGSQAECLSSVKAEIRTRISQESWKQMSSTCNGDGAVEAHVARS